MDQISHFKFGLKSASHNQWLGQSSLAKARHISTNYGTVSYSTGKLGLGCSGYTV